ncbi:copper resistance protein CopC [Spiribacter aquaticus]|uniref:Copper resistance protein CopC n=1 Tax=Spiribacter aquaticus TaxID=1935996 RepID=A0A557RFJ0_9GAMM|nr:MULTISPECIES: copper resistance CopC family protein [Spiribacter]TVO63909.1 copper resistance protein CopC [Spiribacter aquaticus]
MRSLVLPLATLALLLSLAAGSVNAHSMVTSSTPADGATVGESPERIAVALSAPMRIVSVTLRAEDGTDYAVSAMAGRSASDRLVVEPPNLPAGDYTLEWRGLSGDAHTLSAALSFTVSER